MKVAIFRPSPTFTIATDLHHSGYAGRLCLGIIWAGFGLCRWGLRGLEAAIVKFWPVFKRPLGKSGLGLAGWGWVWSWVGRRHQELTAVAKLSMISVQDSRHERGTVGQSKRKARRCTRSEPGFSASVHSPASTQNKTIIQAALMLALLILIGATMWISVWSPTPTMPAHRQGSTAPSSSAAGQTPLHTLGGPLIHNPQPDPTRSLP